MSYENLVIHSKFRVNKEEKDILHEMTKRISFKSYRYLIGIVILFYPCEVGQNSSNYEMDFHFGNLSQNLFSS